MNELQARLDQQARQGRQQQQNINTWKQRTAELEKQRDEAMRSLNLPEDRPLGTHGYGARMISLSVNMARSVARCRASAAFGF
ncbi:MAG: hypothetical protein CMJ64_16780 [Planctomycetaceae bacterium]|nr:hypothetical protein [Planctomycetaceae bacterium]